MHELDALGKELLDAIAKYRVRMPAADFHDLDRLGAGAFDFRHENGDLACQGARLDRIAKFINVFHEDHLGADSCGPLPGQSGSCRLEMEPAALIGE